jgi:predicted  nucleic acid-binding Zn-ribbon protein
MSLEAEIESLRRLLQAQQIEKVKAQAECNALRAELAAEKKRADDNHASLTKHWLNERELRERAAKYQSLAAELSDKLNGTPCAEIRWQQERDALRADLAARDELLREAREELDPHYSDGLCARIDAALKGG